MLENYIPINILEKLKSLIPIETLEQSAQSQVYDNLKLPFLEKMAIMPDCHTGYTLPIGGVALLNGVISPEYVGYDIGCGVCCIVTDINVKDIFKTKKDKEKVYNKIYEVIPVGFNNRTDVNDTFPADVFKSTSGDKELNVKVNDKLQIQQGTLGSGNHFIELGENREGKLSITIHSGSRNPGHSVAGFYMKKSKGIDTDLPNGFFHVDSEWGKYYLQDMNYMLRYALYNRRSMMSKILHILGMSKSEVCNYLDNKMINENHNHAIVQEDGKVLHRKGATESLKDQLGVIPGNMRDGVYIVKGLGNEEYLCSSSHGAGRKGSRKWAKESITMERFEETMKDVVANVSKNTLDESPDAYKDLNEVIRAQEGIVIDVVDFLKPVINIKG